MQWQEVCENPNLKNLPFKIELNEKGRILMSPVKVYHSAFQWKISQLLPKHGVVLAECAIKTSKGTKVADVAWCSNERFKKSNGMPSAPSHRRFALKCSPSATQAANSKKSKCFISRSALSNSGFAMNMEIWLFFDANGPLTASILIPEFPYKVKIIT